jgi:hypothetical protein
MSTPLVTFANPRTAVRAYLDTQLDTLVGTVFPPTAPATGYLQVAWDGTPTLNYPITIRATIRVTCWHTNPTPAEDLALTVLGVLASSGGTVDLWQLVPLTGPLSGVDEDSGYWFASLTFRVSPRPTPL